MLLQSHPCWVNLEDQTSKSKERDPTLNKAEGEIIVSEREDKENLLRQAKLAASLHPAT